MEEKEVQNAQEQPRRFTYEQLEQIAGNLSGQVQHLNARLQEANMFNMFKRLDYLFKVIELAPTMPAGLLSPQFVEACAHEIEELMTPPAPVEPATETKAE